MVYFRSLSLATDEIKIIITRWINVTLDYYIFINKNKDLSNMKIRVKVNKTKLL